MNIEIFDKGKVTTHKSLVLKSCSIMDFHSEYYIPVIEKRFLIFHMFTSLRKINFQLNGMTCLWLDKISLTANAQVSTRKYLVYLVKIFTHNNSLVLNYIYIEGVALDQFKFFKPSTLVYLVKVIRMKSLLQHIFILSFNTFSQKVSYIHSWQPCGSTKMVAQEIIVVHLIFIYYHVFLYNVLLSLIDKLVHLYTENMFLIFWMIETKKLDFEMEKLLNPELI